MGVTLLMHQNPEHLPTVTRPGDSFDTDVPFLEIWEENQNWEQKFCSHLFPGHTKVLWVLRRSRERDRQDFLSPHKPSHGF